MRTGGRKPTTDTPRPRRGKVNTIKLSAMDIGDRGYLASEGCVVELRRGGESGSLEHDLYLAFVEWGCREDCPTIVVDTDEVGV